MMVEFGAVNDYVNEVQILSDEIKLVCEQAEALGGGKESVLAGVILRLLRDGERELADLLKAIQPIPAAETKLPLQVCSVQ